MNFLGLVVESYGTWLLLQRLVDASKDSDIPKNVPFAFAINNRNPRVEISNVGADVREKLGRVSPDQPGQGTGTSSARARSAGGSQGRTRVEPSTLARGKRSDNAPVRIVTLTVTTLSSVDSLLKESQKWISENLINRQILMDDRQ